MPTQLEELQKLRDGFVPIRETIQADAEGNVKQTSTTYVPERAPYEPLPDALLKRRSTLVDAEGNVLQAWQIEQRGDAERLAAWRAMAEELAAELPTIPLIQPPQQAGYEGLLNVFPVGDHHNGMLAWKKEVGESYDLDISEELLYRAMEHLIRSAPRASTCLIPYLGDYCHYDSMNPVTPGHGNQLDRDSRSHKMVRVSMRLMRRMIELAAAHHHSIHVIIESGNHDPYSTIWLREAMHNIYADNPRITIDCSPGSYHYYRFGANLLATHHGDQSKPDKLPGIMAHDRAQDWGETTYRLWLTGHLHQRIAYDFPGVSVETFRVLPPTDAWAHSQGYRAYRDMKCLVFHKDYGEVSRLTVNPSMLEM